MSAPGERRLLPPWGILGGTFDPIHHGHLAIAAEAREALGLAGTILIPAAQPPHKVGRAISSPEDRVAMVELAVAGDPGLSVSRIELERPGPSWAVLTLEVLAAEADAEGRERPVFILSAEALTGFPDWREPARILELARLAVVPRPGAAPVDRAAFATRFPGADARLLVLDGPFLAISATEIRARVAAGRSIRALVPPAVADHIRERGLYRDAR